MSECARLRQQVWPSRLSLHSCSRENTSTQHVAASRRSDLLLNILCPRQLLRWAQDRQAWSVRTAAQAQQPHDASCAGCSVCKRQCLTPSEEDGMGPCAQRIPPHLDAGTFMVESGLLWELPWILACADLRNSTPLVGVWHNASLSQVVGFDYPGSGSVDRERRCTDPDSDGSVQRERVHRSKGPYR